jgi:hypothetical protein
MDDDDDFGNCQICGEFDCDINHDEDIELTEAPCEG